MDATISAGLLDPGRWSGRRLRLSTLIRLRWLAIAGQTAAILIVATWFGFPLPIGACFALIAISAWLNLGLRAFFPAAHRLDPNWATLLLGYDLLQLSGLLYLTGGLQNPFAILLIGPVMVSATTLQPDKTFLLGALTLAAATVLVFLHEPLPWFPGQVFVAPLQYVGGVWIALACALVFMAFYSFRVAEEARQLADALAATELVLQREHHLSALDGLAAAPRTSWAPRSPRLRWSPTNWPANCRTMIRMPRTSGSSAPKPSDAVRSCPRSHRCRRPPPNISAACRCRTSWMRLLPRNVTSASPSRSTPRARARSRWRRATRGLPMASATWSRTPWTSRAVPCAPLRHLVANACPGRDPRRRARLCT
jgi:hypothetical protein